MGRIVTKLKDRCKNGHEYTPENTAYWGMDKARRCRKCKKARDKARRPPKVRVPRTLAVRKTGIKVPHTHTPACEWTTLQSGTRMCVTARRWRDAVARGKVSVDQIVDGLEAQYGPVPPPAPIHSWHDWVVVHRVLSGQKPGRGVTKAEQAEIDLKLKERESDDGANAA
jgi:hypothetical protein